MDHKYLCIHKDYRNCKYMDCMDYKRMDYTGCRRKDCIHKDCMHTDYNHNPNQELHFPGTFGLVCRALFPAPHFGSRKSFCLVQFL